MSEELIDPSKYSCHHINDVLGQYQNAEQTCSSPDGKRRGSPCYNCAYTRLPATGKQYVQAGDKFLPVRERIK